MKIAILQYQWPVQSHTVNLARSLARAGYEVDLVLKRCSTALVDLASLAGEPGVRVVDLDRFWRALPGPVAGLATKSANLWERAVRRLAFTPVLWVTVLQSRRLFSGRRYDCLVGVEKGGLVWAGMAASRFGTPYLYFSLELYDEAHPYFFRRPGFPQLRRAEARYHRKALATIVQDSLRGEYLLRSNGIAAAEVIQLPVSVPGDAITAPGCYLRDRFAIPSSLPIVLFLGLIDEARYCLDAARAARGSGSFALVFHGYGQPSFLERIREEGGAAVVLSTDLVPEDDIPVVVASAQVGLALYRNDCANDRLTAFSSEKVALYCRAGVPFIAFDTESYRMLKERFDCCVLIGDPAAIPAAVEEILADYQRYRANAFRAFDACYRYADQAAGAIARIGALLGEGRPGLGSREPDLRGGES